MRLFDDPRYDRIAVETRPSYVSADPFPHTVLDDFLPVDVLDAVLGEFPDPKGINWYQFNKHHSKKLATEGDSQFGPRTAELLKQLNSARFLQVLEGITGIEGLIPDPYFLGGGLHQIEPGGWLKVHVDFNVHDKLKLDRRVNLIVFLNKDWKEEYNGHLELWDRQMKGCVKKILPIFNRCAIFSTSDYSYHGHPEKLTCPEGMTRKSLALYYYTNGRPAEEGRAAHGTQWQETEIKSRQTGVLRSATASMLGGVASILERQAKSFKKMSGKLR